MMQCDEAKWCSKLNACLVSLWPHFYFFCVTFNVLSSSKYIQGLLVLHIHTSFIFLSTSGCSGCTLTFLSFDSWIPCSIQLPYGNPILPTTPVTKSIAALLLTRYLYTHLLTCSLHSLTPCQPYQPKLSLSAYCWFWTFAFNDSMKGFAPWVPKDVYMFQNHLYLVLTRLTLVGSEVFWLRFD